MMAVFFLYDIPLLPFWNLSWIIALVLIVAAMIDYSNVNAKYRQIRHGEFDSISTGSFIEREYLDSIERLERDARLARDRLTGELNDMTDYYSVWAHQIKTPLAAMSLTVQNIEDDTLRQTLQAELVRTEEYVEMVMGYLRLTGDGSDFVFGKYDVGTIIRQEIRRFRTLFMNKKIGIVYEGTGTSAVTDSRWLGFCLGQIISNAVKYSSGGTVTIIEEEGRIIIKDEGIGISPEDLPRIFEKGYTGYNGRSGKKSTGIGLYLVKKSMKAIGGDVEVTSEPGKGTTVFLFLTKMKE